MKRSRGAKGSETDETRGVLLYSTPSQTNKLTAGIGYFLSVGLFRVVLKASEVVPGVIDWTIPFMTAFLIAAAAFVLFALFYRNPEKRK